MPNFLSHVQYWPLDMMTYYIFPFPQVLQPGPWFNMMSSYQYRKSHCGDKMIFRPSYLHNGISYTDKMTSLYWIRTQVLSGKKHTAWASYQIHKSAGCACAGNAGAFSPPPQVSDSDMHHGTCVTHVLCCMPGSLTSCFLWKRSRHSRRMRNL